MKAFISISLFLLSSVITFAQQSAGPAGFVFVPGGDLEVKSRNVKIKPFFMQAFEVTNEDYNKFLAWTEKNKSKEDAQLLKPSVPKNELKLLPRSYFKSPKYAQYPVVGVTREMAEKYCEYLTGINPDVKGLFRLPFEREWIFAAKGGNNGYTYSCGNMLRAQDSTLLCNYNTGKNASPMPVKSLKPNLFGLYNMSGNVAEWIREDGRSKGGSWYDKPEDLLIETKDPRFGHNEASAFTGFRVLWASQAY